MKLDLRKYDWRQKVKTTFAMRVAHSAGDQGTGLAADWNASASDLWARLAVAAQISIIGTNGDSGSIAWGRNAEATSTAQIELHLTTATLTISASSDPIPVRRAIVVLAIEGYISHADVRECIGDIIAINSFAATSVVAVIFAAATEENTEAERNGTENELSTQHFERVNL